MVDPATDAILAIAGDRRGEHPLKHAIMVCIDLVAKIQGGSAWYSKGKKLKLYIL